MTMTKTSPRHYHYDIDGNRVAITRTHVGTAYARNGNVHNPTEYYIWSASVNGETVVTHQSNRADAYEYARAHVLGIRYSPCTRNNPQGTNVRNHTVVADEMRANFVRKTND